MNAPRRKVRTSPKKVKASSKKKDYTAQELSDQADHAVNESPELALALYSAALEKADATLSLDLLEKRAQVKVNLEDRDGALADYQEALGFLVDAQSPDVLERKASLFMTQGQLKEGSDALESYRCGISEMKNVAMMRHSGQANFDKKDIETNRQLAKAYCAVAELYLTDLCFENDAEEECESYISKALQWKDTDGESLIDALQTVASLRLSQQRGMEAVDFVLAAFGQMQAGCQALSSLVNLREPQEEQAAVELTELEAVQNLPNFEFRCQTSKLLLECAGVLKEREDTEKANRCVQAAVDVLGSLLAENDEVVEVWSLAGDAFASFEPAEVETAAHYWKRALDMLTQVQQSLEEEMQEATDDEDDDLHGQIEDVSCEIERVQDRLAAIAKAEALTQTMVE